MKRVTEEEFWSRIDVRGEDECWPWKGNTQRGGYGINLPHRRAYALKKGKLRKGLVIRHTCNNPPCCNPKHLIQGTQKKNLEQMRKEGRAGDCRNLGSKHGRAKLTEEQVLEIRREYAEKGTSQSALGLKYGVAQTKISAIVRRETWKHI